MQRFWFNLLWHVMAVIIVDIPPILIFFLMHRFNVLGSLAPQVIATSLFLALLCGQAFLHLHFLNRRDPLQVDKNVWTMLAVTVLVFVTFWIIIVGCLLYTSDAADDL